MGMTPSSSLLLAVIALSFLGTTHTRPIVGGVARPALTLKSGVTTNAKLPASSRKRGLAWPWDGQESDFNLFANKPSVSWMYNWERWTPKGKPANIEYVAMQRTRDHIEELETYMKDFKSTTLLGNLTADA